MDRDPIKKGFLLVWPQRCRIIKHCLLGSDKLICATWAVLRVCANVLSATRSFDEKGKPFCISCASHFSFFTQLPSSFWNRVRLHTLRLLGPGLAIYICMTCLYMDAYSEGAKTGCLNLSVVGKTTARLSLF